MRIKHRFKIRDASQDRSAKNSVIPSEGDSLNNIWCRPTTTADFRSSFRQIPHVSNVRLLEDEIQD